MTSNTTTAIADHVSRLLDVYGQEAVECLEKLSELLKLRVEEHHQHSKSTPTDVEENLDGHPPASYQELPTVGTVESIVLQTMKMEQEASQIEPMVQAGLNVLRFWSALPSTTTGEGDDHATVDAICELMTRYPQNECIQEAACVRLSNQSSLLPSIELDATDASSIVVNLVQRILFPVLQAMNWHKNNPVLWNAGMNVLAKLLVKSSSSYTDLTERQYQAMALIDLTGGLGIFFSALSKQSQTPSNKTIQTELKVNVCNALVTLALNHTENQALIAHYPSGLSILLDTMKLYAFYLPLQQSILRLLASLAYGAESKAILLTKGGLDCILTCMKDYGMDPSIQATGCRAIANVFAGTSADIRAKGSLCVKPTLRALRMHPPQLDDDDEDDETETDDNDEDVSAVQIHFYGCAALRNLSKVHARAVVDEGGISTLLVTLNEYMNRPAIQEQAWGAMYFLLKTGTTEDCHSVVTEGGLDTLRQVMMHYTKHSRIQTVMLGCLAFLSAAHHGSITEQISSGRTLDLVLAALHRHHKKGPSDLLLSGCRLLTNIATDYPDAHLPLIIKNGVNVMLMILQQAGKDEQVKLEACRVICQLCRVHDNLLQVTEMTSNGASVSTLVGILSQKTKNLELLACCIEILAHLSTVPSVQKELVAQNRLDVVLKKIQRRQGEESILKVGILLFTNLSMDHDATLWMKNHDLVFWLQGVHMTLPRRSPLRSDVQELLNHLRTTRVFLAKLGSFTGRRK